MVLAVPEGMEVRSAFQTTRAVKSRLLPVLTERHMAEAVEVAETSQTPQRLLAELPEHMAVLEVMEAEITLMPETVWTEHIPTKPLANIRELGWADPQPLLPTQVEVEVEVDTVALAGTVVKVPLAAHTEVPPEAEVAAEDTEEMAVMVAMVQYPDS